MDADADDDSPEAEAALGGVMWWLGSRLSSDGRARGRGRFSNVFLSLAALCVLFRDVFHLAEIPSIYL